MWLQHSWWQGKLSEHIPTAELRMVILHKSKTGVLYDSFYFWSIWSNEIIAVIYYHYKVQMMET